MRKSVDLRTLPVGLQYLISLTVIAIVVIAAWIVGRDEPTPVWITKYLIPILGWTYAVVIVFLCIRWLARRRKH